MMSGRSVEMVDPSSVVEGGGRVACVLGPEMEEKETSD